MRNDEAAAAHLGAIVHEARIERGWTLRQLAEAAGLAPSFVHWVEAGHPASLRTYGQLADALGRRLEIGLVDPRRRSAPRRAEDPVHAAMGELFAEQLQRMGHRVSLDEPYQHFQFAGRGDVVAWDREREALLHVENRTQLPNVQEAAGAYNAKRTWLAASVAERIGIRRFRSVTHAFVGLWSSELLHVVRLRRATITALCPDPIDPLEAWLGGQPADAGVTSSFALLDPIRRGRADRRSLIDLATALAANTRSRYRDYADAAQALRRAGIA